MKKSTKFWMVCAAAFMLVHVIAGPSLSEDLVTKSCQELIGLAQGYQQDLKTVDTVLGSAIDRRQPGANTQLQAEERCCGKETPSRHGSAPGQRMPEQSIEDVTGIRYMSWIRLQCPAKKNLYCKACLAQKITGRTTRDTLISQRVVGSSTGLTAPTSTSVRFSLVLQIDSGQLVVFQ